MTYLINKAREEYNRNLIDYVGNDQSKLFKAAGLLSISLRVLLTLSAQTIKSWLLISVNSLFRRLLE